jgi:proteasome lid subunit RPN8/RPN11
MLTLPQSICDQIIAQSRAGKPEEICGLLRGRAGRAVEALPARNVAGDRVNNYEVDPRSLLRQFEFEEAGDEMVAIYHSHPISVAYPSATDAWSAHYPETAYLICSLEFDDAPVLRAFSLVATFPEWPIAEIRQGLPCFETRPGLWAYFHPAGEPLPPILAPYAPPSPVPFYVVFAVEEGIVADSRLVPVVEIPISVEPDWAQ